MGWHRTKCPRCYGDKRLAGEKECGACNGRGTIDAWEGFDRKMSLKEKAPDKSEAPTVKKN